VDWSDQEGVVDHIVGYARVLAGDERRFEETEVRDLVRRDVERGHNLAALQNHELLEDDDKPRKPLIAVPTLVVHGTADPMFPFAHAEVLAAEIPGAQLLLLEKAGHGIQRDDWDTIVNAIVTHTVVGS
jgi:pimeloyl-ACP methyl ester carboxylesterase